MEEVSVEPGQGSGNPTAAPPPGGVSVSGGGDPAPAPAPAPANGSIATGADAPPAPAEKPYWPEDWRHKVAETASAGDKKAYEKELRRLEKLGTTPADIYSAYRAIENTWSSRNFIKKPGADAPPEELAEFHKALGVPEAPDGYFKDLKLDNGLVLGEVDKPVAEAFAQVAHKAGIPAPAFKEALGWYLKTQEEQAAALDESDDSFRRTSEQALKNEFGNAFRRYTSNIATLFATAPGGTDVNNENSVYSRIMGGRTADGKLIGNDPDVVRWLVSVANNLNPAGSVVEDAGAAGVSVEDEIASLEKRMKEDRKGYFKDDRAQARYRELLGARDKIRARAR